jgi:hypothetical protein
MGHKVPEPVWDMKNVVVLFFFVHGGHDLANLGENRGVVSFPSLQESIVVRSGRLEVVWAPHCYDA